MSVYLDSPEADPRPLNRARSSGTLIAVAAALLALAGIAQADSPSFSEAAFRRHIVVM